MWSYRRRSFLLIIGLALTLLACLPIPSISQTQPTQTPFVVIVTPTQAALQISSPTTASTNTLVAASATPAATIPPTQSAATEAPTQAAATASASGPGAPSGVISNAVMADDTTCDAKAPAGITNSFPADQSIFHAVVAIKDAPTGTRVGVQWMVVDDGNPSEANTKMAQFELTSDGSRNLDFTFKPNGGTLPLGKYRADIYLNGALDQSLDFGVVSTTPTSSAADIITAAVMASDSSCDRKDPVGVTDSFPADQSIFHAVVTISNAPQGTKVKVVWTVIDDGNPSDANSQMAQFELTSDGSRNLDFTFKPTSGRLPPGKYRADVYLNGEVNQSLDFTVAGS